MDGVFRLAYRIPGMTVLEIGTNDISREFRWVPGVVDSVHFVAETTRDQYGTVVPKAMRVAFEVTAASEEEAVQLGDRAIDPIARVFFFLSGSPYTMPRLVALLDSTPGKSKRRYQQWCFDMVQAEPNRQIALNIAEISAHALGRRDEADRDRILRSLKWYTDGLLEVEPVDRFLKAWFSLENVGPIINRRVHKSGWSNCQKCLGELADRQRGRGARARDETRTVSKE